MIATGEVEIRRHWSCGAGRTVLGLRPSGHDRRWMFAAGYIRSARAEDAPDKVNRGRLSWLGVVLDRPTPESFAEFEQAITRLRFVPDCHLAAGSPTTS